MWIFSLSVALVLLHLHPGGADKTINVTEDGNNTMDCWNGSTSCLTLDFALGGLENNTDIYILYSHNFSNTTYANVTGVTGPLVNVTLSGIGQPTIFCSSLGDGIVFWGLQNVAISGIGWEGCSHRGPSTAIIQGMTIPAYSGLFFYDIANLLIEDCYFTSEGRGVGVAMYDVKGQVSVLDTHFVNNRVADDLKCPKSYFQDISTCSPQSGGLYIEFTDGIVWRNPRETTGVNMSLYLIAGCKFDDNENILVLMKAGIILGTSGYHWPFGFGGGLSINIRGSSRENTIVINNSSFTNNTATFGGGISVVLRNDSSNNKIIFNNLYMSGNGANDHSGGAIFVSIETEVALVSNNTFSFSDSYMHDNSANWGGGTLIGFGSLTIASTKCCVEGPHIEFVNCTWDSNNAHVAGAAIAALYPNVLHSVSLTFIEFFDCTFTGNKIPKAEGRAIHYGQGSVYTLATPLLFYGSTNFTKNIGTAMLISSTQVHFCGDVLFTNNQALKGSAIYLTDISQMILHEGLNLTFHHNDAFDSGGAIYYVYSSSRFFTTSGNCFILYEDQHLPPTQWRVNVTFSENKALYGGSAMYVSEPAGCYWPNGEYLLDTNRTHPLDFTRNVFDGSPALGSPAEDLVFHHPVNFTDGYYTLEVMPGEELNITIDIRDYFNSSSVVATMDTKCFNYSYYINDLFFEDICSAGTDFVYNGPRVFVANDSITGISLGGYENNKDLVLNLKTLEAQAIILVLRVFFTKCPYGFYFENETKSCQCYSDNDAVKCFNFDGAMKPCIRIGHWYGKVGTDTDAVAPCPFDTCNTNCQEQCLNLDGWCKLPSDEQQLCRHNHAGPLCAFCRDGYSPNYGAYYCLPNNKCNAGDLVLLIFLMVVFWAIVVLGLLVVLRLDMRLGSGYMYGFVYYFSILPYLAGNVIQNHTFSIFISLFTSLARLDPYFLSFFKICFAEHITPLQMELIRYINPIIIGVLIYLIILANRYCPKLSIISVRSPMHTLCILILLSYTSLLQTSFDILNPLTYPHSRPSRHEIFVEIQPDTIYFDPQHHLPYALVALLVEFCLVIPFTLVMLSAPWLMRWGRMVRFKPIIDEFQACYKDNYRWFAGYYFVARHVVALPPFFITAPSGNIFLQQNLNIIILLVHAYIQPYRERWLNLVDTIFLLDLTLITLLNGDTAQSVFGSSLFHLHLALKIALMTIPCVYFAGVCAVFLGAKTRTWYQSKYKIRRIPNVGPCDLDPPPPPPETVYDTLPGDEQRDNTTISVSTSMNEDRPLLDVSCAAPTTDQANERNTRNSKMPSIFNRVTTRISSQIDYWRTTSYSMGRRRGGNDGSLPGLRGIDESYTDDN